MRGKAEYFSFQDGDDTDGDTLVLGQSTLTLTSATGMSGEAGGASAAMRQGDSVEGRLAKVEKLSFQHYFVKKNYLHFKSFSRTTSKTL